MPTPPPAFPLTTRRLMLLWLSWAVVTGVAHTSVSVIIVEWFPWHVILMRGVVTDVAVILQASAAGSLVGLAQYLLLRSHVSGPGWVIWIPISAVSYGITYGISTFFPIPLPDPMVLWRNPWYLPICAFGGLIAGAIQVPILERKLPGPNWWLWLIPCSIGQALWYLLDDVLSKDGYEYILIFFIESASFGLITGLALVLLLRGTNIPQVKEEVQPAKSIAGL